MPENKDAASPTKTSVQTDWAQYDRAETDFQNAMEQLREGVRLISEGLERRQK